MRRFMIRIMALLMVIVFLVPLLWSQDMTEAFAATATPSLTKTKLEFSGIGETYDINIKNKVSKSSYKWTTSDSKIATVDKSGIVTSVAAGTAMIKCKITYPTKKTKSLSCKVTIMVPATAIAISELKMVNNAYQIPLNGTVDLNAVITPSNSTDTAFWYIDQDNVLSDPTCVTLDANNQGIVTGVKAGKSVVRVRAAKAATQASAAESDIDDAIVIEVVAPKAEVKSADITGTNQLTVVFDSPVQQSTVINTDGTLSSNITIALLKDTKNVVASDPGKLTASLSTDMLTLTITSAKAFAGIYRIKCSSSILTTTNIKLEELNKDITYIDTAAPQYLNTTYDDTGKIATINFNEALDITNLSVQATVAGSSSSVSNTTLSIISSKSNYVLSTDKKSLIVNLSNISTTDYGKYFLVTIAGIKDLVGNIPGTASVAQIIVDTSAKPQAQLLYVERTGYYTLTATFDKAIMYGGQLQIEGGGSTISGNVDTTNAKKVNFTMSPAEAQFTGSKSVQVGFWSSYNVIPSDTSSQKMITRYVNFSVDATSPTVTNSEFDAATGILTLTYSENVVVSGASGVFTAVYSSTTDDIRNGININYTTVTHALGNNIVKLKLTIPTGLIGSFAFTLPQGFIIDSFNNLSVAKAITFSNSTGSSELPGPYRITQSSSNLKEINLLFANKLDVASASTASNYKIQGVTVLSARLDNNTTETGATVVLTVQSIDATVERTVTITGVKGYGTSYSEITTYTTPAPILLKETVAPICSTTPIFDASVKNVIKLNFNEAIQGTLGVTVTQLYNGSSVIIANTVTVNGNCAYITLTSTPVNNSYLKITIDNNSITDTAGNTATFATTTLGVMAIY